MSPFYPESTTFGLVIGGWGLTVKKYWTGGVPARWDPKWVDGRWAGEWLPAVPVAWQWQLAFYWRSNQVPEKDMFKDNLWARFWQWRLRGPWYNNRCWYARAHDTDLVLTRGAFDQARSGEGRTAQEDV